MTVKEHIKHTGATFTPAELADYLSEKILKYANGDFAINVTDPACGEGELLVSLGNELTKRNADFSLTGFDSNTEYLSVAQERIRSLGFKNHRLIAGDFLEAVDLSGDQWVLNFDESPKIKSANDSADIIIANPPYVRTQNLGADIAQKLAKKFNLKGRVDLYYPFLIAMTQSLKMGGLLGVITSNRYLSTKGGESIREYLAKNYEILELIDLGDTKLFDAAVLPAIFIGRKKEETKKGSAVSKFIKIYEEENNYSGECDSAKNIFDILEKTQSGHFKIGEKRYKKTSGLLRYDHRSGTPWEMLSEVETRWVDIIDTNASCKIGDLFKVKVGIKTTADKVFISEYWNDLGEEKPEEELLRDLISQENIQTWSLSNKVNLRVLYTHYSERGRKKTINIDDYPKAKKYFEKHKDQLQGRKYVIDAGREWFEIWVPQKPDFWIKPKLVFPDISPNPRFHFDTTGKIVNGNCYWIAAEDEAESQKLLLIQGIANSELMTQYHDIVFNNKLYSGRRRYISQYVERYPLPDISSESSKEIIRIVKNLNNENERKIIEKLQKELEFFVASAFGVSTVPGQD